MGKPISPVLRPASKGHNGCAPSRRPRPGRGKGNSGQFRSDPSRDGRLGKVRKSHIGGRLHAAKGVNRANLLHPLRLRVVESYSQMRGHRLVLVVSGPVGLLKTQGIEPPVPPRRPPGATAEICSDFSASRWPEDLGRLARLRGNAREGSRLLARLADLQPFRNPFDTLSLSLSGGLCRSLYATGRRRRFEGGGRFCTPFVE